MKPNILLIASSIHKHGNSQIALEYAEKGAKEKGVETDWIILNEYFFEDGSRKEDVSELIDKVKKADGIIWGSPVYFGAWTSLAQEFYEILKEKEISLYPKPVSFVVVGAKRNGGQETTITFASWDLMELGACVVNDGYPISQFGGTCMAGPIGAIEHDEYGKLMCFNVGKRVAETAMILRAGNTDEVSENDISIIHWPLKGEFSRCRACVQCPDPELHERGDDYKCKFADDDMSGLHRELVSANVIIPERYDLRFHERTRYLRRDNYRLTYHVVYILEPRQIPLFMKHNCILARKNSGNYARLVVSGRKKVKPEVQIYEPVGHEENPYVGK